MAQYWNSVHPGGSNNDAIGRIPMKGVGKRRDAGGDLRRDRQQSYRTWMCSRLQPLLERNVEGKTATLYERSK